MYDFYYMLSQECLHNGEILEVLENDIPNTMASWWQRDGNASLNQYETSIQGEMAKVMYECFKGEEHKFHAGGREDTDVRMLGEGRPFVFEIVNPKRALSNHTLEKLKEFEEVFHSDTKYLDVQGLSFSDESCFDILKSYESSKIKSYCCVVVCQNEIDNEKFQSLNSLSSITIQQKTPIRVLHRRSLLVREKYAYALRAFQIGPKSFILYVLASAGTYIKEFVHGDLERTQPNIGNILGNKADIIQLDVVNLYEKLNEDVVKHFYDNCYSCNY